MAFSKAVIVSCALTLGANALGQQGQNVYEQNCAQCHGDQGGGGSGPALANNQGLQDVQSTVSQIVNGGGGMPPYGNQLSDQQIAAVASYIRSSWGNSYGKVSPKQVTSIEQGSAPQQSGSQGSGGQPSQSDQASAQPATPMTSLQQASLGEQRFVEVCSACHGLQGKGGVGPSLAGNTSLQSAQYVITTLLQGREVMPAFSLYPNQELAAIASYIRGSWGNNYSAVKSAQVQMQRSSLQNASTGSDEGSAGDQ